MKNLKISLAVISVSIFLFSLIRFVFGAEINQLYFLKTNIPPKNEISTQAVVFKPSGKMKASWYGPRFHGKFTANGEIYDEMAFTAAHKSLPFGTLLRLTNPLNNKSVIVRINDRGPYVQGRHLDISKGAALELDMLEKGVVWLEVDILTLEEENSNTNAEMASSQIK